MDIKADEAKVVADVKAAETDATAVKSWFALNWHYAVAIAVAAVFLGLALGYKLGMHSHA
jgi:hypothetical protein